MYRPMAERLMIILAILRIAAATGSPKQRQPSSLFRDSLLNLCVPATSCPDLFFSEAKKKIVVLCLRLAPTMTVAAYWSFFGE